MTMYLSNGTLSVLPGNYGIDLKGLLNSGTPYLNYSNVKVSSMITHSYSYSFDVGCTNNKYYDSCKFTSDGSYLNFDSNNAFKVPGGLTTDNAATNFISYWTGTQLASLKNMAVNHSQACIVPNVKTKTILISQSGGKMIEYEMGSNGILYKVDVTASNGYIKCNSSSGRTITNLGKYW